MSHSGPLKTLCLFVHARTINGEDIFDLLLYDLQGHLDPVRVGHGVDFVGVQLVEIQNLKKTSTKVWLIGQKDNTQSFI